MGTTPTAQPTRSLASLLAEAQAWAAAEADRSHDQTRSLLHQAIRAKAPANSYSYPQDVYDDHLVYRQEDSDGGQSTLYKASYAIGDDGAVTLGDPCEVQAVTTYEPVHEAARPDADPGDTETIEAGGESLPGDVVPLVEKAVRRDGTAAIKVISAGWGTSGYYGADVLKRDGPKVFPRGTHMYLDHPTAQEEAARPERSLKDLAAVLESDARWQETGPDGPGLYADAKLRSDYAPLIEELAPNIGVSIRALGRAKAGEAEGRKGKVVESIAVGQSIDFVTLPGRGGKVLQLIEARRGRGTTPQEGPDVSDTQELTEARTALSAAQAETARLREALLLREARDVAAARLAKADLPEITRERLCESLAGRPVLKDGALDEAAYGTQIDEAVKAEIAYLAKVTGSGQIRGMGGSAATAETGLEESEKTLAANLGRLLGDEKLTKHAASGRR